MKLHALGMPLLLTLTLVAASNADADDRRVHVGALGGLSVTSTSIQPEPLFDVTRDTSAHGGAFLAVDLTEPVSLEARVLWSRRSVNVSQTEWGSTATGNARMDYVSIPLLVKVAATHSGVRPFLVAGPELLLKAGTARLTTTINGVDAEQEGFDDEVRSKDVALDVGVGVEIPVGNVSLILEGLYSHGLRNVAVVEEGSDVDVIKTRALRVSGGFRF